MAEPFLAEIRLMSFDFAPKGWALCNGQLLPIGQNQALFSLLGTRFGGDGRTTFALPDYRGRTPIHVSNVHYLGERGGAAAHTLSLAELPPHTHRVRASTSVAPGVPAPGGRVLGRANNAYAEGPPSAMLRSDTVTGAGGAQAHLNLQPFLTISFCIALQGIFPDQD
jgi:microcystin-dependent protein